MESVFGFMPENVTKELKKAEFVARNERKEVKASIPHYFLWTCEECVASSFAKELANVIRKRYVYPDLPNDCYLELAYPKEEASERDFNMFFDSLVQKAVDRNCFRGVFLISLKNWEQANPGSMRFEALMKFVKNNSPNMKFVFCISPTARHAKKIVRTIREVLDVTEVDIPTPDFKTAVLYVEEKAGSMDFLCKGTCDGLKDLLKEVVDGPNYEGFATLERIVVKLRYMLYSQDEATMDSIFEELRKQFVQEDVDEKCKIGFLR